MTMHHKIASVAAIAFMVFSLVLSSCTSTTTSPTSSETSKTDTKPYGSLTTAWANFSAGVIDPQSGSSVTFQVLGAPLFDSLIGMTPDAQLKPGIAERWEISKDGLTHTFYIRRGVKFHDGSDLTGADVKFSIERMLAPEAKNTDVPVWRAQIAGAELKDDYTVALHLKQPMFELLRGFGDLNGLSAVMPKKYIEEKGDDYFRRNPVGSGPWKFVSYQVGNRLELEANENYWGEVPKFKNLTLLATNDEASVVAMLKTGELDIAAVAPDSVASVKSAGLRIMGLTGGAAGCMNFWYDLDNPGKYALGSVKVRKALSLAVNRKEMADVLLGGYADPSGPLFWVTPNAYFYDPTVLKPDPYDPEQAKKLLAEAGYPSGFNTKYWDRGGSLTSITALAVAGYLRKIGVTGEIVPVDYAATLVPLIQPTPKPGLWNTVFPHVTTGTLQFEKMVTGYHSTKGFFKNLRNPRLDELIDKVPQTADPVEKKRLALEAALLARDEYSLVGLFSMRVPVALGPKIGGITTIDNIPTLGVAYETITHAK